MILAESLERTNMLMYRPTNMLPCLWIERGRFYLRRSVKMAPTTMSKPKTIITEGPIHPPMSRPVAIPSPMMIMKMPRIMPATVPPWGIPKHSSSRCLRSPKQPSLLLSLPLSGKSDAPHFTQNFASSSLFAPHFGQ